MDDSYIPEEKYYNAFHNQYIYINDGERLCPKCTGKGKVPKSGKILGSTGVMMLICSKCLGDGKLDWVEEVVGKKRRLVSGVSSGP